VLSGWLKSLSHGAYARPGQPAGLEGLLLGLQRLAGVAWHVGGISALNRKGLAHFLPLGGKQRKPDEYILTQVRIDDFGTMGGHIEALQARVDDAAVFLGIGAHAHPCILQEGPLRHQNAFTDMGFGFDHRVSTDSGAAGCANRGGRSYLL